MVKMFKAIWPVFFMLLAGKGLCQTLHLGGQWGVVLPAFQSESREYHFAISTFQETNQDLKLETLDKQSVIPSPTLLVRYEAKNDWLVSAGLKTSAYRFNYDMETLNSDGFQVRLQTLDAHFTTGFKLFEYRLVNVIPEVGVLYQASLSKSERRLSGGFAQSEPISTSDPSVAGVRADLITSEVMDFESRLVMGRVGLTLKVYNFYLSGHYDTNLTPVDRSGFYNSAKQYNINFGVDLLSFHLIKDQGKHFEK